jgi:hypothetical protein
MSKPTPAPPVIHQEEVAALLEALRAEVRDRRLAAQPADDPLARDLERCLDEIELHRVVSAHWPLIGQTLPQKGVAFVNKVVRRLLRWYINPIVEQQNAYNDAVARALRLLAEAYADLDRQVSPAANGLPRSGSASRPLQAGEAAPQPDHRRPPANTDARRGTATASLQALVVARGAAEPPAAFPDLELRAIEPQLGLRQKVNAHWRLVGRAAWPQKLVRRYLRWLINPLVEQQNNANAAFTAAIGAIVRLDADRRARAAALRAARSRTPEAASQNDGLLASDP